MLGWRDVGAVRRRLKSDVPFGRTEKGAVCIHPTRKRRNENGKRI